MTGRVMVSGRWVPIEEILDRQYTRDRDGKFASTGGVRDSLANAKTVEDINAAAGDEARRITGRDIPFDFSGSDPQIAREHAEGVLRGLERFPRTPLESVGMLADQGRDGFYKNDIAVSFPATGSSGPRIKFNPEYAGNPDRYHDMLRRGEKIGHFADATPTGMATHEFGHLVTYHGDSATAGWTAIERAAKARGVDPSDVAHDVSGYARVDPHELAAESFAAVIARGDSAHPIAQRVFSQIQEGYDRVAGA